MAQRGGAILGCLLVISFLLSGCSPPTDGRPVHQLTIVVGEHVADIERGKLVVYLFAYDPYLADAPADEIDKRELPFQHHQGERTIIPVVLRAEVPGGYRPYVVVRGYEQADEEWRYILWDGRTQTGMPASVAMVPVPQSFSAAFACQARSTSRSSGVKTPLTSQQRTP